ncbi:MULTISPECIES: hypothetical protein [Sphingomonas]|uniref:hypothetical protein n=1 Tax=Sphingomonas TaxID=13687 RepID=UPI0013DEDA0F|nr:hypothetical protein [Sphingomonas sp. ABOLF]GLK21169.1 hypothetical protein GCM10017606_19950 [Microbacterium terregens]
MDTILRVARAVFAAPRRYFEHALRAPEPGQCGCGAEAEIGRTKCHECWLDE